MIDQARERGLEIYLDQFPFKMGEGNYVNPNLDRFLPDWICAEGTEKLFEQLKDPETRNKIKEMMMQGITNQRYSAERYPLKKQEKETLWEETLTIVFCGRNPIYEGKTIAEVARMMDVDPYDAILNLLISEEAQVKAVDMRLCDEDVEEIMKYPHTMIGSDGGILEAVKRPGIFHPRQYGTFARILGMYVREKKILRIEEAIRRMTSLPAQFLRLRDRGMLKEGMYADITIFDPKKIGDRANIIEHPSKYVDGINYVITNGKLVVEEGNPTGTLAGKVLKHLVT
jgi:N-acyl-D-amino-acid deacylase